MAPFFSGRYREISEIINNLDGQVARLENCTEMTERDLSYKETVTDTAQADLEKLVLFLVFLSTAQTKKKKWKTRSD